MLLDLEIIILSKKYAQKCQICKYMQTKFACLKSRVHESNYIIFRCNSGCTLKKISKS